MIYQFTIDIEQELMPEPWIDCNVFSMTLNSKTYTVEEEMVTDCNSNVEMFLAELRKLHPDFTLVKIKNNGSEEFSDDEVCKLVIFRESMLESTDGSEPSVSDVLDTSVICFSIFAGE